MYVNIHPPRNDAEQQVLTQQFLTTFTQQVFLPFGFLENTKHERSFANQQNAITDFESFKCIELLLVP